jgi:hypothetical protein
MRKWTLFFMALLLGLSACQEASELPETPAAPRTVEIAAALPEIAPPQDILGEWVLDQNQSTFGASSMLDPLEAEFFEAIKMEITGDYLILGDFGHSYSWIDEQRIRVDGVVAGFGSATEGFFYIFTVQREGDILRLLTSDGTPFAVFGRAGSAAVAPIIVVVSTEEIAPEQPAAPTPWTPCESAYETHLFKGGYAFVNPVPPEPNLVRSEPNASSAQIGLVQPNELMEITAGPQCSGGWVWWQITSKKTGLSGWTAEGNGGSYWVLPCPIGGSECGSP